MLHKDYIKMLTKKKKNLQKRELKLKDKNKFILLLFKNPNMKKLIILNTIKRNSH